MLCWGSQARGWSRLAVLWKYCGATSPLASVTRPLTQHCTAVSGEWDWMMQATSPQYLPILLLRETSASNIKEKALTSHVLKSMSSPNQNVFLSLIVLVHLQHFDLCFCLMMMTWCWSFDNLAETWIIILQRTDQTDTLLGRMRIVARDSFF